MAGKTMPEWIREMDDDALLKYAIDLKDRIEKPRPWANGVRHQTENEANLKACRQEWKRREALRRQLVQ